MKKLILASMFAGAFMGFALLTAEAQTKIMCFGDSVTSSQGGHDSYRRALYFDLVNAGFPSVFGGDSGGFDFVGRKNGVGDGETPPDDDFDENHEGWGGLTSAGGISTADAAVGAHTPDIVLLDLGSNDPNGIIDWSPDQTQANLQTIIETFHNANSNVIILLALSTPEVDVSKKDMGGVHKAQAAAARSEKAAGVNVILVNLGKVSTYDGIHPDAKGEEKIAKKYFGVLKKIL